MSRSTLLLAFVALVPLACTSSPASTSTPRASTSATPAPSAPQQTQAPSAPPSQSPAPTRTAPAASTASAKPVASAYPTGSVIVTFKVDDEKYRVLVTDPANVAIVHKLLKGKEAPRIPNGLVVRGEASVNTGWSWHIDPASLEFADMTTEVCDGLPSFVEAGTITGDRFCPWSAEVVAVEPANP